MTGEAMRLKLELARLMRRHRRGPVPFTPLPPRACADGDVVVDGFASPATVDRERMKFGIHCWLPFGKDIPLLYRHDQDRPAGILQQVRATEEGLYVRALLTDAEAKQCQGWSVGATIHSYRLFNEDDPEHFYGLVTCATLDEVSLPASPVIPTRWCGTIIRRRRICGSTI